MKLDETAWLIPFVGGIAVILFPSQARDIYTALCYERWSRNFFAQRSELFFRLMGIAIIAFSMVFRWLEKTTPH